MWIIIPLLVFVLGGSLTSPALTEPLPSKSVVSLNQATHFLTPAGEDILLEPGEYRVEQAEGWMQLIPRGKGKTEGILLEAHAIVHDVSLTGPTAVLFSEDEDEPVLTLLLPDGTGLETFGTVSGVRSKAVRRSRFPRVQLTPQTRIPDTKPVELFPLSLSSISIEYSSIETTYQGNRLQGEWQLPVSDSIFNGKLIFGWTGYSGTPFIPNAPLYQQPVRSPFGRKSLKRKRNCCVRLLMNGQVVDYTFHEEGGNFQVSFNPGYVRADYWPKTVKLIITREGKRWESPTMIIHGKAVSHFATELYPIFSHPRCTTCHSLGDREAIVTMHQARLGADVFPDNPKAQPQTPKFCAKCHTVKNWRSPSFVQGLNWGGKTAIEVCKTVTGRFTDKSGQMHPPLTSEELNRHFGSDTRLFWALFDGAKPFGNPPTLPVAMPEGSPGWFQLWRPWVQAGTPCPTPPFLIKDPDLIQPSPTIQNR